MPALIVVNGNLYCRDIVRTECLERSVLATLPATSTHGCFNYRSFRSMQHWYCDQHSVCEFSLKSGLVSPQVLIVKRPVYVRRLNQRFFCFWFYSRMWMSSQKWFTAVHGVEAPLWEEGDVVGVLTCSSKQRLFGVTACFQSCNSEWRIMHEVFPFKVCSVTYLHT